MLIDNLKGFSVIGIILLIVIVAIEVLVFFPVGDEVLTENMLYLTADKNTAMTPALVSVTNNVTTTDIGTMDTTVITTLPAGASLDDRKTLLFGSTTLPTSESQCKALLTSITVQVWMYDETSKSKTTGSLTLEVNKNLASDITAIFNEIYANAEQFPIITSPTYCYSYREKTGSATGLSEHAFGSAIDINPTQNPYYASDTANPYLGKSIYAISPDSSVVNIFKAHGWTWGGEWTTPKDYMHFSYMGG